MSGIAAPGYYTKDGMTFEVHPCISPELDFTAQRWREELRSGLQKLSPHSRWQRFASGLSEFSEEQLDYLTDIDGKDRVAWCAVLPRQGDYQGLGVARYISLQQQPAIAEFAITVIDEFQGRGIGSALLSKLLESACENSFEVLRGFVFPNNTKMLKLCRKFNPRMQQVDEFLQVDIPLTAAWGAKLPL